MGRRNAILLVILVSGCSVSVQKGNKQVPDDTPDLAVDISGDDGGGANPTDDGGGNMGCDPNAADNAGCSCDPNSTPRYCYPKSADPKTRHVGACKDGKQQCAGSGEFWAWGACTGAVLPTKENCTDKIDNDCNGVTDCKDPACATDPSCRMGCTNGATRACYDGPQGTENVGICKDGTQTCANGQWPMNCPGEVLPEKENCGDAKDHNCNHLPGCLDVFTCALDPACQPQCKLDPGCVCPKGSGEGTTCPDGYLGISKGGGIFNAGTVECCPCTANDCGNPGCCGEQVCKGNPKCGGFNCKPLPMACNGQVGFDCDDFTEDCDVMCCKCTMGCP